MAFFGNGRGNGVVERDMRPVRSARREDFAPPEQRAAERAIEDLRERSVVNMDEIAREIAPPPEPPSSIDRIRDIIRTLTYGEMREMCCQIAEKMPKVEAQDTKDLIVCALPDTMHAWSLDNSRE